MAKSGFKTHFAHSKAAFGIGSCTPLAKENFVPTLSTRYLWAELAWVTDLSLAAYEKPSMAKYDPIHLKGEQHLHPSFN